MTLAKLSTAQAAAISLARQHADDATRKEIKREIFAAAKQAFGIPDAVKLKYEDNPTHADYLVLKNSATGAAFTLDATARWDGATPPAPVAVRKAWFRVPYNEALATMIDALEVEEGFGHTTGLDDDDLPDSVTCAGRLGFNLDSGAMYVLMDADHFTE